MKTCIVRTWYLRTYGTQRGGWRATSDGRVLAPGPPSPRHGLWSWKDRGKVISGIVQTSYRRLCVVHGQGYWYTTDGGEAARSPGTATRRGTQ